MAAGDPCIDAVADRARELFKTPANFVLGAADVGGLPADTRAEIAFAGRSNVGKSSLLNALLARRNLARVSNTPGRTRELNYFSVGESLFVVDMPGYGYAKAPKTLVKGWTQLIHDYLHRPASVEAGNAAYRQPSRTKASRSRDHGAA